MGKSNNGPVYYTVADIVEYYEVSGKTVWRWIKEGRINAKKRNVLGPDERERRPRRMWCVTAKEFNRIEAVVAYNRARMPVSMQTFNAERSANYRERVR